MEISGEKTWRQRTLENMLRVFATLVLKKYHPIIVGVTGSVGKSSTKEAIALVLSEGYAVRRSEGNYNNEFGVPLSILGEKSPGASLFGWMRVMLRGIALLLFPFRYPEILVLEMGVDRPGDMDSLLRFVPVTVGVITRIGESHIEYFKTIGAIAREKSHLVTRLGEGGIAVLNADDERVLALREKVKGRVITYSLLGEATVSGEHYAIDERTGIGFHFKLRYEGTSIPVRLPNLIGEHLISSALAAVAVGLALKMNPVAIVKALEKFESLPGRMRLIAGTGGALLIDDTYNASPDSVMAALLTLGRMRAKRKIFVFGDMLELGDHSDSSHRALAPTVSAMGLSGVFLVGEKARLLGEELASRGFSPERIFSFDHPKEAGIALRAFLREGDVALLKGSQGLRMELAVEQAMEHPGDAAKLLCRQSEGWRAKPYSYL
jgi:UDP-N-acetylmuramoyl-tripeptide--D-alanyl-D-alanine ligase